jgi:hypothetical protein
MESTTMSAVEEIEAAIVKLKELRDASVPGPWKWEEPSTESWPTGDQSLLGAIDPKHGYARSVLTGWGYDASGIEGEPADRELIVTLHRTLDAQLALLTSALGGARDLSSGHYPDEPAATELIIALAKSINGTHS